MDVVVKTVRLDDRDALSLARARKETLCAIEVHERLPGVLLPFLGFVEAPGYWMKTVWEAPGMTLAEWMRQQPLNKIGHREWVRQRLRGRGPPSPARKRATSRLPWHLMRWMRARAPIAPWCRPGAWECTWPSHAPTAS